MSASGTAFPEQDLLDILFDRMPMGVAILDRDLGINRSICWPCFGA